MTERFSYKQCDELSKLFVVIDVHIIVRNNFFELIVLITLPHLVIKLDAR